MNFLIFLLTVFLVLPIHAADKTKPFGQLQHEQKYKDYTVRIYRNEAPPPETDTNEDHQDGFGCFEILRSGKQVYFQKGGIFGVGSSIEDDAIYKKPVKVGQSIIGNKQPDLVISEINGGNNSLCDYYIFQIGDTFKFIDKIKNTGGGEFMDLRGSGDLDLITRDVLTFEGWNCCEAASPQPTVIYRYQDHKYRLDLEKMKKPAPTEMELQKMAKDFKAKFADVQRDMFIDKKWSAPSEMWGKMLDLIYSGNMASAWKLCDQSWPAHYPNKELFLKDFIEELQTSPYYKDINQPGFQKGVASDKN
jgi:hypothetical protein